jgi:hypothetical protein
MNRALQKNKSGNGAKATDGLGQHGLNLSGVGGYETDTRREETVANTHDRPPCSGCSLFI